MKGKLLLLFGCLWLLAGTVSAQTLTVRGEVVTQEKGEPIVGASVMVKGTTIGSVTDANGKFVVTNVPSTATTLRVSYIGTTPKEVQISKDFMKITLKSDAESLNEVVVVAYGTAKKGSLTGSVEMVNSKEIEKRINTNVAGALEGTVSGVQVNNTYGEPGSAPNIRIRGFGTLNSEAQSPLYVVDGVPYTGNIADLNSNDIESLSVLKDAASAALYGNRAANGVVLITTKSGKGAKPAISFQANTGMYTRGLPEYDRLTADKWMEASWMGLKNYKMNNDGLSAAEAAAAATKGIISEYAKRNIYNAPDDKLFDNNGKLIAKRLAGYDDLNWSDALERTGVRQEYNLSGNISSDKFNVYSSAGYLKEQGYIVGSDYQRLTARLNASYTPNKWLKTGLSLNASTALHHFNDDASGGMLINPFQAIRYMAPIYPFYTHKADGSFELDKNGQKTFDTTSPYLGNRNVAFELRKDKEESRRNLFSSQAFATLTLPYDFSFTFKGDLSKRNVNYSHYGNPLIGDGAANNGRLNANSSEYTEYTLQQLLNWSRTFDKHSIDAMLGHENYSYFYKTTRGMNTTMAVADVYVLNNFINNSFFSGYDDSYRTESYLGRLKYNYDEKYFVETSLRRDGSSRFYKDNRWGNFYSLGLSWNIKREDFMKDVNWVNQLKFRTAFGEVGNDAPVSFYGYMALYEISKNGANPALIKKNLPANDIKWETTQTYDIALEGRLFDRVNFTLGYFDKRSKDLLFQVRLPLSAGAYYDPAAGEPANLFKYKNIGTISNRGVELSMDADIIKTADFRWNVGMDATFLSNKIVKLPDGKNIIHGLQNYSEGHSIYEYYTYHFEGVDQMNGKSLYTPDPEKIEQAKGADALVNINGKNYVTATSFAKRQWSGTALPTVYGSLSTSFTWKDLSLNALFTYSLGGKTYDGAYHDLMGTTVMSSGTAFHTDVLKSWNGVPAGMTETSANRISRDIIPIFDFSQSNDNNAASDRWLTSASYFIFKNINLSYSLPKTWMSKIGLGGVQLTAGAENLFTLTSRQGLNPQLSFSGGTDETYVTARVFNMGVKVNF